MFITLWPELSVLHLTVVHRPPLLRSLHRLPVKHRITYKVSTLTFNLLHHQPTNLYELLSIYSPTRQLRSSAAGFLTKLESSIKTSDRAFAVAAATTWNTCPRPPGNAHTCQNSDQHFTDHSSSKDTSLHAWLITYRTSDASDSLP